MKILFDLQLSFIDKSSGKFKVDCDSNFNFTKNALIGLYRIDHSIDFGVILPFENQIETNIEALINQFDEAKNKIKIFQSQYYANPIISRYYFDFISIKDNIEIFKPDIIWTNDPCRVGSYRSIVGDSIKIISYNHWIDNPKYPKVDKINTYFYRQVEGAIKSDFVLFNTSKGISIFIEGMEGYFDNSIISQIQNKCDWVIPSFNFNYLVNENKFDTSTIIFNHRLSSLSYYKSNFEYFINICEMLHKNINFKVILTNPSGYNIHQLPEYMTIMNYPIYIDYLKLISKCHIGVGLFFDSPGTWSMSLAECAALGIPLILPNKSGYKEIVQKDYPFLCANKVEAEFYLKKLLLLSKGDLISIGKELQKYAMENYSPENAINNFYRRLIL